MANPVLHSLHYYPVKGMAGHDVSQRHPEPLGLRHDRRWMLVDANGRFLSQRQTPGLVHWRAELLGDVLQFIDRRDTTRVFRVERARSTERPRRSVTVWDDTFEAYHIDEPDVRELAAALGAPAARLVYLGPGTARPLDPHYARGEEHTSLADAFPYLLTNTASLNALNAHLGTALRMDRFRPNLVIRTDTPWAEDHWSGVQIGPHRFRIDKPCGRCQVITIDQQTGERRLEVLAGLSELRRRGNKVLFGVYGVWEGAADQPLRVGEEVRFTTTSPTSE